MTSPAEFFDTYCGAVASLDPSALLDLYAEDARVFDAMVPDEYADREEWAGMVNDWFGGLSSGSAQARDVEVVESDDLAVLNGHMTYAGVLTDGEEVEIECRITLVLERIGEDDWRIVHEHNSVPIDMDDEAGDASED
ncbi:MAG TPA: nuclear transport factor 2 family protein [Propionibacterium sp.]|nr:nuclear transport factor 2 family protein [Propionibacterium sp.]